MASQSSSAAPVLGRAARKKLKTRTRLLKAAYDIMSKKGVDATSIAEIAEAAGIGFGTFYNYYDSKDELAGDVLERVIEDLGRRNDVATASLKGRNPAAVQAISIRLVAREMMTNPMWRWWFARPDLLVSRMQEGFRPFAVRDLELGIEAGRYAIRKNDADAAWSQQVWMLVGGVKDMLEDDTSSLTEPRLIATIMRAMGVEADRAEELADLPLPELPPSDLDFNCAPEDRPD